ncbi:MAG TPA: DivIVA domain-containing protein [Candidatus Limnocylindrales bacterium]
MTVFWVLLGIAVLGGVAVVAAGRGEGLVPTEPDRPDLALPEGRPVAREDVDRLRFSVGFRGYRMDEVDDVLDRLAADLALRDAHIDQLERQLAPSDPAVPPVPPVPPVPADTVELTPAEGHVGAAEQAEHGPVEGAALLPPATDTEPDLTTARTLLVPLEQRHDEPDV